MAARTPPALFGPNYRELQHDLIYDLERRGLLDGAPFVPRTLWRNDCDGWAAALMMFRARVYLMVSGDAGSMDVLDRPHHITYTGQLLIRDFLKRQRHRPDHETGFGEGS